MIGLLLGVAVTSVLLLASDIKNIGTRLHTVPLPVYGLAVFAMAIVYVIRISKWHYLIRHQNIDISLRQNASIYIIGLSMAITPGKAGELIKTYWLRQITGKRTTVTSAAVLFERLADLAAVMILAAIGLIVFPRGWFPTCMAFILMIAGVMVIYSKSLGARLVHGVTFPVVLRRFRTPLWRILLSIRRLLSVKVFTVATILSLCYWLVECAIFYGFNLALDTPISWLAALLIFTLSALVGAFSFLPGGLGAIEGSLFGLMVFFGASAPDALTATLLIRLFTLWLGCIAGWLALLTHMIKKYIKK